MKLLYLGLTLQTIFLFWIILLNSVRVYFMEHYTVYSVAFFELFLGVASFICGIIGLIKKANMGLSIMVMVFGVLICFFFVFIYLLSEAGIPPAIPWLYSE
ncbi:hypothetical protein QNK12_06490 [Neobacillus cucumis]|nr:hypothetical protein QNK12_06490 [Neobacillus cucumis]